MDDQSAQADTGCWIHKLYDSNVFSCNYILCDTDLDYLGLTRLLWRKLLFTRMGFKLETLSLVMSAETLIDVGFSSTRVYEVTTAARA